MARNQEKAQSMLNRWITYKKQLNGDIRPMGIRPSLASECDNLTDCERWRMQIIREVGKKVVEIQNESLGEQRIRDLNDGINKQLREKAHWERRIIELGGPNYRKLERVADEEMYQGKEPAPGTSDNKGSAYKYFGAAKNLPGVKELFARKERDSKRQKKFDMRGIDAAYYGYNDEDSLLEQLEEQAEKKALENALKEWETYKTEKGDDKLSRDFAAQEAAYVAIVNIPEREQIEKILLEKRKEAVMKKFLNEDGKGVNSEKQKQEADSVLGKRKTDNNK